MIDLMEMLNTKPEVAWVVDGRNHILLMMR